MVNRYLDCIEMFGRVASCAGRRPNNFRVELSSRKRVGFGNKSGQSPRTPLGEVLQFSNNIKRSAVQL